MAGNKFNTAFKKEIITECTLLYTGLYGGQVKVEGTPQQIVNHLMRKMSSGN